MLDMKDLGTLIADTRRRRGIATQRELGITLGKDPAWVSRLENGTLKETPAPEVMRALAAALGLSEAALLEAAGYRVRDDLGTICLSADDPLAEIVTQLRAAPPATVQTVRALLSVLASQVPDVPRAQDRSA